LFHKLQDTNHPFSSSQLPLRNHQLHSKYLPIVRMDY
jgi:hypothetical protein